MHRFVLALLIVASPFSALAGRTAKGGQLRLHLLLGRREQRDLVF